MSDIKEEYHLKNLTGSDAKKILEIADQENIDVEAIIDFIKKLKGVKKMSNEKTNDEIRFGEEEKKVQEFMAKPENKGVSYRDAVLKVLDRTEPKPKKEFTEEEIKKRENLKAVENYLSANPRATYKEAVKVVLRGEESTLEEKLVEEYMEKNPGSTYKDAVIEALSLLEKRE
ncbi:hypothetical protein ES695_01990 [Candidatus Atribacteria bacterium 1244-E10-H5-B2]|nr:MAG: hypothetical protein ES695_01990 [Candidatus Atribacteria bacterium 1244-E10-H5-B2]